MDVFLTFHLFCLLTYSTCIIDQEGAYKHKSTLDYIILILIDFCLFVFQTFHDSDPAAKAHPVLIQIIRLDFVGTSLMGWYLDKTQVTYLGLGWLW